MKKSIFIILAVITGFFLIRSTPPARQKQNTLYPAAVRTVVDNKCYGCHSVKGKSQDAKDALMWDSLPGLTKSKMIATLNEIIEVLDKNEMPPPDVVKKYPEMKLEAIHKKTLMSWAEHTADSLLN